MRKLLLNKFIFLVITTTAIFFTGIACAEDTLSINQNLSIDRIELVTEQINLLKSRLLQADEELKNFQQDNKIAPALLERASKNLLDKSALDISVAKSNLDSLTIELADSKQTYNWLEKNIQDTTNQLNVLNIFGLKMSPNDAINVKQYQIELSYQKKLLILEKERINYLERLQKTANTILQERSDRHLILLNMVKARNLLNVKQKQVKDELYYQKLQNRWLAELNTLYTQMRSIDPLQARTAYSELERKIFYANENASFAYIQSLLARYKDQIRQMQLAISNNNSISLLNQTGNQVQALTKQINRLSTVIKSRTELLGNHLEYLTKRKANDQLFITYINNLRTLQKEYVSASAKLSVLNVNLNMFRHDLDVAIQNELSARQGLPIFSMQTMIDLGKEILLVPALSFQVIKSLTAYVCNEVRLMSISSWMLLACLESILLIAFVSVRRFLSFLLAQPAQWHAQFNSKWLSLQCMRRSAFDLLVILSILVVFYCFNVPTTNYMLIVYLAIVWFSAKTLLIIARVSLIETTHDTTGHDVKLYQRLKWIILLGGAITALTVFVHQLPLIYELKALCDNLFLLLLLIVSLLLLRTWEAVPTLILSRMENQHPYLQSCIRLIGLLIPTLLLANSIIGLAGFVNLILTISWYEGVFLIVLIGYLIMRGLLSDGMEQLSRLLIQYANNGWLWTEAFLKPLDKVLRIALFLSSWIVLFLLYGWDKQSPIVVRLTGLMQYELISALNTTITPMSILELLVVISVFYWTAKWTREFVYRLLLSRTKDMGIRNSIAILSQYTIIVVAAFICLRVLGINLQALTVVAGMFAFGIGLGLRDLANNFVTGFLLLFERPLRVGDIININGSEGEVTHVGSRAVTIRTWDHMEMMVPNSEIFSKSFTNWTAVDNVVRSIAYIKISRYDNPHTVKVLIQDILANHEEILKDPVPEVLLFEMTEVVIVFEIRYHVNIRQVKSRVSVMSSVLMEIWDTFKANGIKAPYPQHEIFLKGESPLLSLQEKSMN